jgi:hypothetical protein
VGADSGGTEGDRGDVPISSPKSRPERSGSGANARGVEGSPPGRPGSERRLTTSEPSSANGWWRLASRSCSWRGICWELLKRALVEFSGRSAVEVEAEVVC